MKIPIDLAALVGAGFPPTPQPRRGRGAGSLSDTVTPASPAGPATTSSPAGDAGATPEATDST